MPASDLKITALSAIATNPINVATFPIPMVDLLDNSMAASGTTKKVTVNQILGAGGTATLASATITGDLTVATSSLKVTGGNTGFGTTSPLGKIDVRGTAYFNGTGAAGGASQLIAAFGASGGSNFGQIINTGSTWSLGYGASYSSVGTSAVTWDSSGNLGLGIAPSAWGGYGAPVIQLPSGGTFVASGSTTVGCNFYYSGGQFKYIASSTASYYNQNAGQHAWYTAPSGTAGNAISGANAFVQALTLNANGCLALQGGNTSATGVGIAFPATQAASSDANTLDDYEEGTFTPTIIGSTAAGTGTYNSQTGRYTKVGNLVTIQVFIDWTAHTGTGNMRIGNLPFTNANNFWAGSIGYANAVALTAGNILTGYVEANQSYVTLQQYPTGGGTTTAVPIDTAAAIIFSASYTV